MIITIKNDSSHDIDEGSNAKDLADKLNIRDPHQALCVDINGTLYDLSHELHDGDVVELIDFNNPRGRDVFWHTSAHVLAQAILRLWPEAKPTIGPSIEQGFYYDFANLTVHEDDFKKIEKEMKKIISENHIPRREIIGSKNEALKTFAKNKYKCALIEDLGNNIELTAYRQGEFLDLCRGPHLPSIKKIKALKIMKTSGAYWRGDANNEMLTRIYGVSFPNKETLQKHLHMLEEAKRRDHRILGTRLSLFSLHEESPGMPLIHPKGAFVWEQLVTFMRECHKEDEYKEIKTPIIMSRELWETSGHWDHYRENMYTTNIDNREFAIKPMNCPGCLLYYRTRLHSYKELPLRIAEFGVVHRNEPSGAISGLFRVRCFHQDDAHIFMELDDLEKEILKILHLVDKIYTAFGLTYTLELSTRPERGTIGSDKMWDLSTIGLKNALECFEGEYTINEGDGAFYGPKIDVHIRDTIGRTWQCGTIQVDMALPEKFNLEYTAHDGTRHRPVMIHRAIYGSVERFFGILIEHFAGKFPLWLSPHQLRIIPIADRHVEHSRHIQRLLKKNDFSCDIDDAHESVSKKIRNAQLEQINYILTVGDREVENSTATLRTRDNIVHGEVNIEDFIETIIPERINLKLSSPYSQKED